MALMVARPLQAFAHVAAQPTYTWLGHAAKAAVQVQIGSRIDKRMQF
ncbi:MAG: hypothetical protein WCI87_05045 [Euryarchaeota archaeon]